MNFAGVLPNKIILCYVSFDLKTTIVLKVAWGKFGLNICIYLKSFTLESFESFPY